MKNKKSNQNYRKAVFIVVFRKNKEENKIEYVLLKRKLHWKGWEFPKGGVEGKEDLRKAVFRECYEETGLKPIKILKFNIKGKYKYSRILKDRPGFIGQNYRLFAVEVGFSKDNNNKIKIDKREHYLGKWVNFQEAIKLLHWSNQKKCLNAVDNFLNKKI
jgi:8-oxo-dGTP pyrophosphatase MutT (NUDIX family)